MKPSEEVSPRTKRVRCSSRHRRNRLNWRQRTRKRRVKRGRPLSKPKRSDKKNSTKELLECAEKGHKVPKELEMSLHRIVPARARQGEENKTSAVKIL